MFDPLHSSSDSLSVNAQQDGLSAESRSVLDTILRSLADLQDEATPPAAWTPTLLQLDAQGQAVAQECLERFLDLGLEDIAARRSLCDLMRGYWGSLLSVYGVLLDARVANAAALDQGWLPHFLVHAMRAAIQCAKWDGFGHGPLDEAIWKQLNCAYRTACRFGINEVSVRVGIDQSLVTSAEREYRRVMAFHSLGLDQFNAWRLELADRILDRVLDCMALVTVLDSHCLSWVDTALALPPGRLVHTPMHAALPRYLRGPGVAVALNALRGEVEARQVDESLRLIRDPALRQLGAALAHMIRLWSDALPMRKHRRHVVPGRLRVIGGMHRLVDCLAGEDASVSARDWMVRDISLHGLGMDALDSDLAHIEVGSLLGVHAPDGNRWRIGTVRRLWHSRGGQGQIGVELLGDCPVFAEADDGERRVRVLLLDPLLRGMKVRMVLPLADAPRECPLYVFDQHRPVRLTPLPGREFGVDYEIRSFQMALA